MKPATLLNASGISPGQVSSALGSLDLDHVNIRPAPAWLTWLWGRGISAMAIRTTVYIRAESFDLDPSRLGRLVVHELVHVHQWLQMGVLMFLWRYMVGYLRGRLTGLGHQDAYRTIPIEVEARQIAGRLEGLAHPD